MLLYGSKLRSSDGGGSGSQTATAKPKPLVTNRFGKNFLKIGGLYIVIITVGITTFYFAKKEVNQNRIESMKIRKEIVSLASSNSSKYPNRFELIRNEKN